MKTKYVAEALSINGFRKVKVILMVLAIGLSVLLFSHTNNIRDNMGLYFIQGYNSLIAADDYKGIPSFLGGYDTYEPGNLWYAKWVIRLFYIGYFFAILLIPVITWKKATHAIAAKKQNTG
jgi:hypothetical protein